MLPQELKLTFKELLVFKKNLIVVAITGITGAAFKGYIAIFIKQLIDASSSPEKLKSMAWIGIAVSFGIGISRYFHIFLMNLAAEKVSQSLREQLQAKFMKLNLKFHNTYASGSGGLISRTMNDIRIVHDGLRLFADLFSAPLIFIFLTYNLFILDTRLTIYILLIGPVLALFIKQISKGIRKYSIFGIEQLEKITSTVKESLDGVKTIQAFNLEKMMESRLHQQGQEFIEMRRKVHARVESTGPITEFIATFMILGVAFYFSQRISVGLATAGSLIGFITALLQINEPIKKFQEAYVRIQETRVAAARVFHLLDEKNEIEESALALDFPSNWDYIEYKNISFAYGDHHLIKQFNLKIKRGQAIAFVGESGSGKTTLANLLARFYDPSKGEIVIGGKNIKDVQLSQLRKNIGLVSQDVFLFSDTIEKNIQAGIEGKTSEDAHQAARAAFAHDFILKQAQGYQTQVGERGNLLSGGEKQRVGIARALYKDAPILILDEATSALDSVSEVQVQKGLETLMEGRTTLVIAHRLSTIQKADQILVLKKGQIVEQGTHAELLEKNGEYTRLFQSQVHN
jgi:ATP-binding cassette subfamily B protein/subfamily B ATP-binding cassette protein MsbA